MVQRKTLFLLSLIVLLFGCSNNGPEITTMKMLPATAKGLNFKPASDFAVNDPLFLQVENCGDKDTLIKIYDGKGNIVSSEEHNFPKKAMDRGEPVTISEPCFRSNMETKEPGNYSVAMYIDNKKVASCEFAVIRAIPYPEDSSDK